MFPAIKKWFGLEKCEICRKPAKNARYYFSDAGKKVPVCRKCVSYAERRAWRKR